MTSTSEKDLRLEHASNSLGLELHSGVLSKTNFDAYPTLSAQPLDFGDSGVSNAGGDLPWRGLGPEVDDEPVRPTHNPPCSRCGATILASFNFCNMVTMFTF